jgi:hypothetical protein
MTLLLQAKTELYYSMADAFLVRTPVIQIGLNLLILILLELCFMLLLPNYTSPVIEPMTLDCIVSHLTSNSNTNN